MVTAYHGMVIGPGRGMASTSMESMGPLATVPRTGRWRLQLGLAVAVTRADTGIISEDSNAEAELTRVSVTININILSSSLRFTYFRLRKVVWGL